MKQRYTYKLGKKQRKPIFFGLTVAVFLLGTAASFWLVSAPDSVQAVYEPSETAVLQGDELLGGGTDLNVGTATALDWNLNQEVDSDYYSYSGTNSSRLTIESAGDYYLSLTVPMTSSYTDTNERNSVNGFVYINGSKQDVGVAASGYIRNLGNHDRSSIHLTAYLDGLSVNDYIEVFVQRDTTGSNNTITSDTHSLYVRNVDSETLYAATGTQTTNSTNLNQATAYEMEWSADTRKDSGYTHSTGTNPEDITLDSADDYFVSVNIPLSATFDRPNIIGKILLGGTEVSGSQFKHGYIRNSDGHNTASIHYSGTVSSVSASQVLSVSVELEAAAGTVTVGGEKATIYVERLPASGVYSGEATELYGGGTDWSINTPVAAAWETDNITDSSVYSHSTITNPQQITINDSGNYFVNINIPLSGNNTRVTPIAYIAIDGQKVDGLELLTGYIRNEAGQQETSLTFSGMLNKVGSGSVFEVYAHTTNDGANPVPVTDNAQLTIVKQSIEDDMVQAQSRWYRQNSTLTPNSPWLPGNMPLTLTEDSQFYGDRPPLRLRIGLTTGTIPMIVGADNLNLQYANSTSGPWFNVGEQIVEEPDVFYEDYEAGSVGSNIESINSNYTDGYSGGTGTYKFDDTYSVSGDQSGEYDAVSNGDNPTTSYNYGQTYGELYYRFYFRVDSLPTNDNVIIFSMRDGSYNHNGDIQIRSDGKLGVRDDTFVLQQETTNALPTNQWIRVEGHFDYVNEEFEVRVYENHTSSTPTETLTDTATTFTSSVGGVRIGMVGNTSDSFTLHADDFGIATDDWMGHISGGINPDWDFYDQTGVTDGANLSSTLLTGADDAQSFVESNPSPANPVQVDSGGDMGEWDFSLDPTNASSESLYYFRVASDNGFNITYNYYPRVKIHKVNVDEALRGGAYFEQQVKQGFTF